MQDDLLNASALDTVMVIPLTSNLKRAEAIGNILVTESESGLPRTSVALVCQIQTLDKDDLDELVGSLPLATRHRLDRGLALAIGLSLR